MNANQSFLFGEPFHCVVADPPWDERGGGRIKRGADRHYPLLTVPEIIQTMLTCPHWAQVGSDAHLWLWVTDNFLEGGLEVMKALGFRYIRTLVWVKVREPRHWKTRRPMARGKRWRQLLTQRRLRVGLGQYLRGSHELALFGVRGKSMVPPPEQRRPSVVVATRGRHSAKPDEAFGVFESVSPGPRLEIFARRPRDGWTVWGNEVGEAA